MPYTRKTSRKLTRHFVTLTQLSKANCQVTREMAVLGLWCDALDEIDVWLVPVSFACYGWFRPKSDIYIPAVNGASLSDLITGNHTRLTDVLRHEWAHAVADRQPRWIGSKRFIHTFGDGYESGQRTQVHHPDHRLTRYAATSACEDFAETFHHYLRHKGRLPVRLTHKPVIVKKWQFVEWLVKCISAA